jgi:hypothetical protein
MAVDVSQVGQIEIPPLSPQQLTPQALGRWPVVVFGIGVGAQGNDEGGLLQQIHRAGQVDGGGPDGLQATRKDIGQRLVESKRTAILKNQTVEYQHRLENLPILPV